MTPAGIVHEMVEVMSMMMLIPCAPIIVPRAITPIHLLLSIAIVRYLRTMASIFRSSRWTMP